MQSSDRVLARRYAEAFYARAAEDGDPEGAGAELAEASRVLAPRLAALKDPRLPAREKKAALREAAPDLAARTRAFLELLIDNKRLGLLPAAAEELGRIVDERAGRVRAQVRSAAELSGAELDALAQRLKLRSGKEVLVEAKVDPDLLGGGGVRMGDLVLDGSLQGELRALAQRLIEE